MIGKAWWQEAEAVGHFACAVRKQRERGTFFLTFLSPFYSAQDPAHEMMLSTFRVGLPILIYLIKIIPQRHVWRLS